MLPKAEERGGQYKAEKCLWAGARLSKIIHSNRNFGSRRGRNVCIRVTSYPRWLLLADSSCTSSFIDTWLSPKPHSVSLSKPPFPFTS